MNTNKKNKNLEDLEMKHNSRVSNSQTKNNSFKKDIHKCKISMEN